MVLRPNAAERPAVELRAASARRRPLLPRAEVVDVAEDDVAHPRPLRHGDRETEVSQPSLRVDRTVDRIDDDACLGLAEGALAELLGDEQELVALRVQLLEPRDDRPLGRIVDRGCVVSADARCEHRLALDARRQLVEDAPDVSRRRAAGLEPRPHSSGWNSRPERSFG